MDLEETQDFKNPKRKDGKKKKIHQERIYKIDAGKN